MAQQTSNNFFTRSLTGLLLLAGASIAMADQVSLAYVDANSDAQILTVDASSDNSSLAKVAGMLGENGAALSHDPDNGSGSLAEIAEAMATASPADAADIAQALAALAPDQAEAIVAAVNSVSGVDTNAVLAAVHFGPSVHNSIPPTARDAFTSDTMPPQPNPPHPVSPN